MGIGIISWIKLITVYLMVGVICTFPLAGTSAQDHIPFILGLVGVIIFMSQFQATFAEDFQDDHLAWCLAHKISPLKLVTQKLWHSILNLTLPLCAAYVFNLIFWVEPTVLPLYLTAFTLTLLGLSGWALLLTFPQGKNQSILIVFILPLAIPSLLVSQSLFSAIALGQEASYYLAMNGGLALFSIALSLLLSPLAIRSISW
jgi:ABC-type transport system involved in cytochrome c biogenesis permease component